MEVLAIQEYIKVERRINSLEQMDIEHKRYLRLYRDKIASFHREFTIDNVLDISYRKIGGEGAGLLYLHTIHGVYSYIVKSSPMQFIDKVKSIISSNFKSN